MPPCFSPPKLYYLPPPLIMIILEARVLVCLVSVCYVLIQVLVAVVGCMC